MHVKHSKLPVSFVLDNGAYTAKIGTNVSQQPKVMPNSIMKVKSERRRPFVGDQINDCRDASGLFYILPFQKGYLVNWDIQKTVWDYMFSKESSTGRLCDSPICITEPMFNFQSNQEAMDEIFFEEYECCGVLRLNASDLAAYHYSKTNANCKSCLVIDTGYSFTHVVPYIKGEKYVPGIRRIDVGGKVLTNHLKEIISYRQLHVMDETYVINQVKEDACFVSENFRYDMMKTWFKDNRNTIIREYLLPDYSTIKRGYVRNYKFNDTATVTEDDSSAGNKHDTYRSNKATESNENAGMDDQSLSVEQQTIVLNNERITIPEILFHPSDIGIPQKGIAETVVESVNACPKDSIFSLLGNIVVMGGNAQFPNFNNRLYAEIRSRFDENMTVNLLTPTNPVTYAWFGGKMLASNEEFYSYMITKEEYEEHGHGFSSSHFKTFRIAK